MPPPKRKRRRVIASKIEIHLLPLTIRNSPPQDFMRRCNEIPLLGYHVETLSDGTKVCVTKPGGKTFQDFQVWVVRPNGEAWRPSHGEIKDDLELKCIENTTAGKEVIRALKRVHGGAEPEDAMKELSDKAKNLSGYSAEMILKAYKWIFAQEDCNHAPPRFKGRNYPMEPIDELLDQ